VFLWPRTFFADLGNFALSLTAPDRALIEIEPIAG
jgi:hypothetical protein